MAVGKGLASRLNQRVDIMRQAEIDDGKGGSTTEWVSVSDRVPAEVEGLSGREVLLDKVLQGIAVYRITLRHRSFDPSWQVRYGDIDLNVRSAFDPHGDRRELVILADTDGALSTR